MSLQDGQSQLDSVSLTAQGAAGPITNWESFSLSRRFLDPCQHWSFTLDLSDPTVIQQGSAGALIPGTPVQIAVNGLPQCTGFIEVRRVDTSTSGGNRLTISGRDILGPVVKSTVDPSYAISTSTTLTLFLQTLLAPYGIGGLWNSDLPNLAILTGLPPGASGPPVGSPVAALSIVGTPKAGTSVSSNAVPQRPDLTTITILQAKPHAGEGVYAYCDRLLKRLGLAMWAMADGSGVVIDAPYYDGTASQQITHYPSSTVSAQNNVISGSVEWDMTEQPSVIVATGFGSGPGASQNQSTTRSKLRVIKVNELCGFVAGPGGEGSTPLQGVQDILTKYPNSDVLPPNPNLLQLPVSSVFTLAEPFFDKDDEAKTQAQLEAFVCREMGRRQARALRLSYVVKGLTSDGTTPWAVNTKVTVNDAVFNIQQPMWIMEREFRKDFGSGTQTHLKLIRPYCLVIGPS